MSANEDPSKEQIREARGKFVSMVGTYCLGVFNDNFFKQAACLLAVYTARESMQNLAVILFTLPWLLFAAPAGYFADRFSKRNVVIGAKALELVAMTCGAFGIIYASWPLIMVMMFTMALQSTIFSPALNGSIPELYPKSYVIKANSTVKMIVTAANLVGMILAGIALNVKTPGWGGIPTGRLLVGFGVVGIALVGLVMSLGVVKRPAAAPDVKFPWAGPVHTVRTLWNMRRDRLLATIVIGDSFVWFIAVLQILFINSMGRNTFSLNELQTSYLLIPELLGVAFGGVIAGFIAKGERWHWPLGPAMLGLGVFSAAIAFVPMLPESESFRLTWVSVSLLLAGMSGGILLVPMESFFQIRPAPSETGTIIAASNFAGFFGMMLSGAVNFGLQRYLEPTQRFGVIGAMAILMAFWLHRALGREDVQS